MTRGIGGIVWCAMVAGVLGAESGKEVPSAAQALSGDCSFALFVDAARVKDTGFWKSIGERLPAMEEQLKARIPGGLGAAANLEKLKDLPGFPWDSLTEVAVVTHGQLHLGGGGQSSKDAALVATARFAKGADIQSLINGLLAHAETEKPGSRTKAERSRRKFGNAEVVDLPSELFEEPGFPFTMSLAGVSAGDASWLGLGRTETVEGLIRRRGTGGGVAAAKRYVPQGAQVWLYAPIPAEATQALASHQNSLAQANPIWGPMAEGLKNVRDFALAFTFGERGLDLLLALGCVDGKASSELGAGLQGFVGLIQSTAGQRSAGGASYLRNLKVTIDGSIVRMLTSVSLTDIPAPAGTRRIGTSSGPTTAAPAEVLTAETKAAPVTAEFTGLVPGEGEAMRWGRIRFQNTGDKAVRTAQLKFIYLDKAGRSVGEWTRRHTDLESDQIVGPASTRISQTPVFQMPASAERVRVEILEVGFADGSSWKAGR